MDHSVQSDTWQCLGQGRLQPLLSGGLFIWSHLQDGTLAPRLSTHWTSLAWVPGPQDWPACGRQSLQYWRLQLNHSHWPLTPGQAPISISELLVGHERPPGIVSYNITIDVEEEADIG